jgi:predicted dehydrogenase
MIEAGELGAIRLVSGHYLQDWLLRETDWNWRLEDERGGRLRTVGDIGSHWLDLVAYLTGRRVESVLADLATFLEVRQRPLGTVETFQEAGGRETEATPIGTEDCATMLLRLEGGIRGALALSQVSPGRKNSLRLEVDGSEAAAAWDSERPDELWIGHRDRPNQLLLRDPALLNAEGRAAARLPGGHAEGFLDAFRVLHARVYEAVAAGGPPEDPAYPTFADGHEEMLIGDAVLESAREGRWAGVRREEVAVR